MGVYSLPLWLTRHIANSKFELRYHQSVQFLIRHRDDLVFSLVFEGVQFTLS